MKDKTLVKAYTNNLFEELQFSLCKKYIRTQLWNANDEEDTECKSYHLNEKAGIGWREVKNGYKTSPTTE